MSFLCKKVMSQVTFALSQQTNLGAEAYFHEKESERNAKGGGREQDSANLLKRVIFSWQPCKPFIT